MATMEPLDLLHAVTAALTDVGARHFVTGSMAAMLYGRTRYTNDVDIVADLRLGHAAPLCARFPEPDYYASVDSAIDAIRRRGMFNIIHVPTALKADIILPEDDAFNDARFDRARKIETAPSRCSFVSSPEDIIVHKLRFFREGGSDKHLSDIAAMLQISGEQIDVPYIEHWAERFGVADIWRSVMSRAVGGPPS